ncbi:hypothetical protein [Rodentibacter myodis]|uniref:DUF2752 domain-containing protein n=1 Tax=Rodentibacter myodis TaxID=1907939 RepID=A0A1V3JRQ8_9PAST|nr:hypothetical protein [Rodentibacter myodis]OOF59314.1 hypothetical protein BKL49_04365 [Rodentibacter myodis]
MKCKCPACGAILSLDVLLQHEQATQAVISAMQFNGEFGRLAVQYLALFRPDVSALTMHRVAKLLGELMTLAKQGEFARNGQIYAAPLEAWIDGFNTVLNNRHNIKRPLVGHGYLLEVMSKWQEKSQSLEPATRVAAKNHQHTPLNSKTGQALANLAEFANGKK